MGEKNAKKSEDLNTQKIIDILLDKAALKQDVHEDSLEAFNQLKELVKDEMGKLQEGCNCDERIRVKLKIINDYEFHTYIGSDVLVFQVHTNVFRVDDNHELWNSNYLKEDGNRGYFGVIFIYNFLAESFIQNRLHDVGHLIGRIFVNKDYKFFAEGQGQLGFLFKDLATGDWTEDSIRHIIQVSFAFALEFDLLIPPFGAMQTLNVEQIQSMGNNSESSTGKRLGFKYNTKA